MLIEREHSRLSGQVKTLESLVHSPYCVEEFDRVLMMADDCETSLSFGEGLPKMLEALEVFAWIYASQSGDVEWMYAAVVGQEGVYCKGHWAWAKHHFPGVEACLDWSNNVLPEHRAAFRRAYEADRNLTAQEQSDLLKAQYALICS